MKRHSATHSRSTRRLRTPPFPQLPWEVCEFIIDALGQAATGLRRNEETRALTKCALVCRAWRPRAQLWIFRQIILSNPASLSRLKTLLEASPGLATHIRALRVYCGDADRYTACNLATAFPAALGRRVTSLREIHLDGFDGVLGRRLRGEKLLEHLPLHPCFQILYRPYSTVTILRLSRVTFPNFADFIKFVSCFAGLRELRCDGVKWFVLGRMPCNLGGNAKPLLNNLRILSVRPPVFFVKAKANS